MIRSQIYFGLFLDSFILFCFILVPVWLYISSWTNCLAEIQLKHTNLWRFYALKCIQLFKYR